MSNYIVYKIQRPTESTDNRQYIGVTSKTLSERFRRHKIDSKRTNPKLFNWLKKHPDANIMPIASGMNKEEALALEKNMVPPTQKEREISGFLNLVSGGGAPRKWSELSEEEKSLRKIKIGQKHRGKIMSAESRQKMSQSHKGIKLSIEQKRKIGASLRSSKTKQLLQFSVCSPSGEKFTVSNLKAFCERHNLERSNMTAVIKGKRNNHKGWSLNGVQQYQITSPDGKQHTVHNVNEFSIENNLNRGHMNQVKLGKESSYKGWKITLIPTKRLGD